MVLPLQKMGDIISSHIKGTPDICLRYQHQEVTASMEVGILRRRLLRICFNKDSEITQGYKGDLMIFLGEKLFG